MSVDDDGFTTAGAKTSHSKAPLAADDSVVLKNTNPNDDPRYNQLLVNLQQWHRELQSLDLAQEPVKCGEYLGMLRLNCNKLFAYINIYIDEQINQTSTYNARRQSLYQEQLKLGKSPSAADKHAGEFTRVDSANLDIVKMRVQQIRNEYERYNGICLYLQSRMKEFNTERMMN